MKSLILDTSVAVKWFSQKGEEDLSQALALRESLKNGEVDLIVPELFFVELANALRHNPGFTESDVKDAVASIWQMDLGRAELSSGVLRQAVEVGYRYGVTVYDALFVASAQQLRIPLITADYQLCRKLTTEKSVIPLKDWPSPET